MRRKIIPFLVTVPLAAVIVLLAKWLHLNESERTLLAALAMIVFVAWALPFAFGGTRDREAA